MSSSADILQVAVVLRVVSLLFLLGFEVSVFECNTGAKSRAFVDSSVQLLHIFC